MTPPPPTSTLFPYTTLFRSAPALRAPPRRLPARRRPRRLPRLGVAERERSEEHTSELQSRRDLVCRLLLEKKKKHDISRLPAARWMPLHGLGLAGARAVALL